MRLSSPLGLGVTCPEGSPSPSSDERVPSVVAEKARAERSSLGFAFGCRFWVLRAGAFGLDDQNAGIVSGKKRSRPDDCGRARDV